MDLDNNLYFISKKKRKEKILQKPSHGPFFAMNRVGKNKLIFKVHKIRTMHPYSEFLQSYMINKFGYAKTGKPASDFRLTSWGKFFRKYWIDELPQIINVLRGELSIVGCRPVSEFYFNQMPEDIKKLRVKFKPGCIPPYLGLNSTSDLNSVYECERLYLNEKLKNPIKTDIKYFFNALYNIIFKSRRGS